jgi:AcrR family transcriptional regulator
MVQTSTAPSPRAVDRKRAILAAAARVFREKGLHRAGMREIAAAAGMTAGNLYYYFESKEELLAFCQQDALDGLLALAESVEGTDKPPEDQLRELIVGHVRRLNEGTPGSLAHLEIEALDDRFRAPLLAQRDRYEQALRRIVARGVAAARFRSVDPKTAALAVLGAANWTVKWFRAGGGQTAEEIGQAFADHLVRGLLAPGFELASAVTGRSPGPRETRERCPQTS